MGVVINQPVKKGGSGLMMLFFNIPGGKKVAIPFNRVYQIFVHKSSIICNYDGGEFTYMGDYDSALVSKVETATVTYESEAAANDAFRKFFVSCTANQGAFYFG